MSEKALRDYAIQRTQDGRWGCLFCSWYSRDDSREFAHSPDCLLVAEPDIVVILRWLYDHMNIDNHMVVVWIREEFGVQLTKDGWEWIE